MRRRAAFPDLAQSVPHFHRIGALRSECLRLDRLDYSRLEDESLLALPELDRHPCQGGDGRRVPGSKVQRTIRQGKRFSGASGDGQLTGQRGVSQGAIGPALHRPAERSLALPRVGGFEGEQIPTPAIGGLGSSGSSERRQQWHLAQNVPARR